MRIQARIVAALACVALPAGAAAQSLNISLQNPGTLASANDFAAKSFQDPWDMNQRTDFGWFLHGVDDPQPGFSSFTFSGGVFSGTTSTTDPTLWLLETGFVGAAPVGKIGTNHPIDANTYKIVAIRMRVQNASAMVFFWSTNTIYDSPFTQTSNAVPTEAGWKIYFVNLQTLGLAAGTQPWSGTKRSLRWDPTIRSGETIDVDWVRLVDDQAALHRAVSWTGPGTVDIYLASSNTPTSDPNAAHILGLLARNHTGGSYDLNAGALAPGTYHIAMRQSGTNNAFTFSSQTYTVNDIPTVNITSPSEEGSADDFATTVLGNPWDFNAMSDVDLTFNVTGATIGTVMAAETPAGTPLGNPTAFIGTNTTGTVSGSPCASHSDPIVSLMHSSSKGFNFRIDPNRYRILTTELGIPNKARGICAGSIVRIVWQVAGDTFENVSNDIVLNTRAGANVFDKINVDMKTLEIEPASPANTGWTPGFSANPGISGFRVDPHEYVNPTQFYIRRVKLAALESAHTSFNVGWTSSEASGTVNVYFDTDKNPASKTLIGSTSAASTTGNLTWNTSSLSEGEYFIYVEFDDGLNTNGTYSKWPMKIDHTPDPTARLVPNRTSLNFGVRTLRTMTPPQTVRVTTTGGSPCWTVTPDPAVPFVLVSPTTEVCGSGSFTVRLLDQNYVTTGVGFATLTISSSGAINSPQFVRANYRISNTSAVPVGFVDTPTNNATRSGSVGFTGWAVDDIGVTRVTLCRDRVSGDPAPFDGRCGGAQEIYVGDAVMLDDSRPDIASLHSDKAFHYRGGWGFLLLTNMLPFQGNHTFFFRVRAFDVDGNVAVIGTRTLTGNNSTSPDPFGAIDTPGQGATISGTAFVNFGWVLTPQPKFIPANGSTINVFIDSVPIGTVDEYGHPRSDINALFPGYRNNGDVTPGAIGFKIIDTTAYANGVHTIAWGVADNTGAGAGVGSRFFTIFNSGGSGGITASRANPDLGRTVAELGTLPERARVVQVRRGFNPAARLRPVSAGPRNVVGIWHTELDRVEVHLDGSGARDVSFDGYQIVNDRLLPLPVGSSLDRVRGVFGWQPGVGYLGRYEFLFVRTAADGSRERIPLSVVLEQREPSTRFARARTVSPLMRGLFQVTPE